MSECAYAAVTSNRNQPRIFSDAFATVAGRRGLGGTLFDCEKGKFSLFPRGLGMGMSGGWNIGDG